MATDTERFDYMVRRQLVPKRMTDTATFMVVTVDGGDPATGGEFDCPREAMDDCMKEYP